MVSGWLPSSVTQAVAIAVALTAFLRAMVGPLICRQLQKAAVKPVDGAGRQNRSGIVGPSIVVPHQKTARWRHVNRKSKGWRVSPYGPQLLLLPLQMLLVNAVNVVILAFSEASSVFPPSDPILKRCLSPTAALARATVRWVLKTRADVTPGV